MAMEEKLSKKMVKIFVLVTKYLPMLIALIHFINTVISYFYGNDIPLNYLGGVSLLSVSYLYLASYTFKLCEYYRMFLHYIVACNILSIYDFYIGVPLTDVEFFLVFVMLTIVTMFVIIYLKFFKK